MMTFFEKSLQELKSEVDILIPLYVDHPDRIWNLYFVVDKLKSFGFSNIFIRNYTDDNNIRFSLNWDDSVKYSHHHLKDFDNFNKMKCVNEMVDMCESKYLAIYDVDVIFPKKNLLQTLQLLKDGADVVYPYDGHFYNVPKTKFEDLDKGQINLDDCELCNPGSYGGAVFYNRKSFIEGGKCNPNFKNVGFDDNELYVRFAKLGYDVRRTEGPLLHLDHYRSETSVEQSPFLNHNMQIYNNICAMSKEQLLEEIKTW